MENGENNVSKTLFFAVMCMILGIYAIVIAIFFIIPALNNFYSNLHGKGGNTNYITSFLFLLISIIFVIRSIYYFKMYDKTKHKTQDDTPHYGKYDKKRDYYENKIINLNDKLISSPEDREKIFHLINSSNDKSALNSGNLFSGEFLSKYNVKFGENEIDNSLVFVLTPFGSSYKEEYYTIRNACNEIGLRAMRGDETYVPGDILTHIIQNLAKAQYVIANINGRNPNVFYELGIAHMMNKQTILISHVEEETPFNIQSMRIIYYQNIEELHKLLKRALQQTRVEFESLQYDENMDTTIPKTADKVKRILDKYTNSLIDEDNTIELIRPFFTVDSPALKVITSDQKFDKTFIKIIGEQNLKTLAKLLVNINNQIVSETELNNDE
jgi:predicted PurR-regulated permease PerM